MSTRLNELMPRLLTELPFKEAMRHFKKRKYGDYFTAYRDRVSEVNDEIGAMLRLDTPEEEMRMAARALAGYAGGEYEKAGRFKKNTLLIDMQCMMVFYVLPSLLSNGNGEGDRLFADTVVEEWKAVFPESGINAATYDEIYSGFRDTIFGISLEGFFGGKK